MSDESVDMDAEIQEAGFSEMKKRAKALGISFSPNIGEETLAERIKEYYVEKENEEIDEKIQKTTKINNRSEAEKLVRVIVTCMDPTKKAYSGDLFSVGNGVLGSFTKYIEFGVPWHVPQIMVNMIDERKYLGHVSSRDARGNPIKTKKMLKTYAIQRLEPLDEKGLEELKQVQILARNKED